MTTRTIARAISVLLVEDNPGDARLILEMLRDAPAEDFDLERVSSLETALQRLSLAAVDVVLLDLGLPDSEGLETYSRIQTGAPHEPIVVISGLDDERVALEAVRAGAQDYLVKGRIESHLLARAIRYAIQRKSADHDLRASEARLGAIMSAALDAHVTMDESGAIAGWNPQAEAIFGWPVAEVMGRQLADLIIPPAQREAHRRGLAHYLATGEGPILNRRLELTALRRDGREFPVELSVTPLRLGKTWMMSAFIRDITERRHAEEALRASEQRARTLFDTVRLIVLGLNSDAKVDYVNPFFLKLTGYTREEVLGEPYVERFIPEAQRAKTHEAFTELLEHASHPQYQNSILTKSGEARTIEWHNTVLRDAQGRPRGTFSIGEDITDHNRLEEQLRQAQRMEAVGRLAGGVAHDFNNVLTAILGYADILLDDLPSEDAHHGDIMEIRTAAQRAAGLTRQLLAFSRQQVLQPTVLNVNDVVTNLEKMLRRLLGEDVELRTGMAHDAGNVHADAGQLEQVLMNLAVNARDAMPTGGKLTIETANADLDDDYAEGHQSVIPGPYVLLAVSDTGQGISPVILSRIFEPFFTTKEQGKGTGLGLSTVYGIVKQSNGYVWVYSEPGQGTTFKVYLPRVATPVESPAAPREVQGSLKGTETILLAEDDEQLRRLAKGLLDRLGYTVLAAANTEAALVLAREHPAAIHLLLTDVVMPGESGRQLATRLAEGRPDMQVLYMSGYTDAAIVHHGMLEAGLNYLQKPFTPVGLARRVRDVLDKE